MRKLATYFIFPELKIIVESYKGQPTVEDAINYKKSMILDHAYHPNYNIITDLRSTEMQIKSEHVVQLSEFLKFLKESSGKRKVAMLTDKPSQTVLAQLLKDMRGDMPTDYEAFSTLKPAISFVGLNANVHDLIKEILIDLSRKLVTE